MRRPVRIFLLVVLGVVALAAVVALVVFFLGMTRASSPTPTPTPTSSGPIESPTPSAAAPSPLRTDDVVPDPEPTPVGPATVTIVNWGSDGRVVYASGLVTGDAGVGGVCTLTATSADGQVLSAELDAQATPAAVNCGVIEVAAPAGEWMLVLGYRSDTGSASSAPTEVDQP
ncbi:MAG: hypothetical protein Q7T17_15345 [Microbacterium sp.]|uniref:hypothetical protein n=1 Tax=Microbacterium sp. TaxID=51671 RepID=UPI0027226D73|nr:hypothetical protein [Microbacterium sp.]MDO8384336.1 hypothetical protein [Microbacterium sp.]